MKTILTCITFIFLSFQAQDMAVVRQSYKDAAHDKSQLKAFYNMMEPVTKNDHVALVSYKGAALALQAKYAKTIKEKKKVL